MLRVLATWDPKALPAPHEAHDSETESAIGILPRTNASEWFATAWDPLDEPPSNDEPFEYIRETPRGIEMRRHPESVLRDSPRLWDVVSKWRSGVAHEITREEYSSLTNYEIECWLVMVAAHNRETERRIKTRTGEV